jgi:hypothetical protein
VKLDLVGRPHACRRSEVDARVTDRGRDLGEGSGLVCDLDDQVVRDACTLSDRHAVDECPETRSEAIRLDEVREVAETGPFLALDSKP